MALAALKTLRGMTAGVARVTRGIPAEALAAFDGDAEVQAAIAAAQTRLEGLLKTYGEEYLLRPELELCSEMQSGYVNFYDHESLMPFVPLAAKGPWVVTLHGAVVHDDGGYGMLGFGHNADFLTRAVGKEAVMSNLLMPSFAQVEFIKAIRAQIGFSRPTPAGAPDACPYARFMCLNSGSEAVELSTRFTDIAAKKATAPGGVHAGRKPRLMVLEGSFYGRTYRPARLSHVCRSIYQEHLHSFATAEEEDLPIVVAPNDIAGLEAAFAKAEEDGVHVEAMYMEPVMGEGQPGKVINRDFYDAARRLTREHSSMLVVDSIQAALRARGSLSVVDFPGFEDADAPDMETYSKAINAGQVPLSILALQKDVADSYVTGLYGNTMTTNPRALDVATATLNAVTPEVRKNIQERGEEFKDVFSALCEKNSDILSHVTGSGLLQGVHLTPEVPMLGGNHEGTPSMLARARQNGLGIINAAHALKFTSHFNLSSAEVKLLAETLDYVCADYRTSEKVEASEA